MHEDLSGERSSFVTHLECAATGRRHEAGRLHGLSEAGKPLLVRYDLPRQARALDRRALAGRAPDIWRYRELLPVARAENIVSLGENITPLIAAPETTRRLGGTTLLVRDEGWLPTGSFKARGLSVAVSMAKERNASFSALLLLNLLLGEPALSQSVEEGAGGRFRVCEASAPGVPKTSILIDSRTGQG